MPSSTVTASTVPDCDHLLAVPTRRQAPPPEWIAAASARTGGEQGLPKGRALRVALAGTLRGESRGSGLPRGHERRPRGRPGPGAAAAGGAAACGTGRREAGGRSARVRFVHIRGGTEDDVQGPGRGRGRRAGRGARGGCPDDLAQGPRCRGHQPRLLQDRAGPRGERRVRGPRGARRLLAERCHEERALPSHEEVQPPLRRRDPRRPLAEPGAAEVALIGEPYGPGLREVGFLLKGTRHANLRFKTSTRHARSSATEA